ncbi:IS3 family transposase [Aureimonas ureilytica]|uniref:IS3 family transposase n=1 Tax=Aureimonas ureilytica TaxID=401562 RepID=UPI00128F8E74
MGLVRERDILKKPSPTLPGSRCDGRVRCEAPRDLGLSWLCEALGVWRSGVHVWLVRAIGACDRSNGAFDARIRESFLSSNGSYAARRFWHDHLAGALPFSLHRIERLMRLDGLMARPRRCGRAPG